MTPQQLHTNHDGNRLYDGELDLFKLFTTIWSGRVFIVGIVFFVSVAAFVGLKLSPSYYRVEATIDALPNDEQLRIIFPSVLGVKNYQVQSPDEKKIYARISLQAGSLVSLKSFWEMRTGKKLSLDNNNTASEDVGAFKEFSKALMVEIADAKGTDTTARKIVYESKSRTDGINLLNDYLSFLMSQAWNDEAAQLEASYGAGLRSIDVDYSAKTLFEERKLSDDLINLHESLKLANSMGIKDTPFKELENIQLKIMDNHEYLLGVKSLSSQIEILSGRQGKSLAPFSADLRHLENWRDLITLDMKRLQDLKSQKVELFSIINNPEASLDPVKPRKALIFAGIVFVAFFGGVLIVLMKAAIDCRPSRNTSEK